jgi:hypothetical protein
MCERISNGMLLSPIGELVVQMCALREGVDEEQSERSVGD